MPKSMKMYLNLLKLCIANRWLLFSGHGVYCQKLESLGYISVCIWCASRQLKLNAWKTELIWFGSRTVLRKTTGDRSVTVVSMDVQPTDTSVRNLGVGVLLDSELMMKQHINKLASACFYRAPAPAETAETSRVSRH